MVSAALLLLLASGPHAVLPEVERLPPPRREPRVNEPPKLKPAAAARARAESAAARRRARTRADSSRPDGGVYRSTPDAGLVIRTLPDGGVYSEYGVPDLTVPGAEVEVPVSDTMVVDGLPIRLKAIHSSWTPEDLYEHYRKEFDKQGLYVDPNARIPGYSNPHITGLDPVRGVSYTVLLTREVKGTTVFLGEAHLSARKPVSNAESVPTFPGARNVMHTDVEAARAVTYVVKASPPEVFSFYDSVLTKAGFSKNENGAYEKDGSSLEIFVTRLEGEDVVVRVMLGGAK